MDDQGRSWDDGETGLRFHSRTSWGIAMIWAATIQEMQCHEHFRTRLGLPLRRR
jgi:hypothetical protein